MSDEARNLIYHCARELANVAAGMWWCESGINAATVSEAVRREVEAHFREHGYSVARERRLSSGKRLRGLWLKKPAHLGFARTAW